MKSLINQLTQTSTGLDTLALRIGAMSNNGYEFGLALLAISVGLVFRGAGSLSADRLLHAQMAK